MPFLENVLRGRNVPRERMLEVAEHYQHFGGVSPINEQNRALDRRADDRTQPTTGRSCPSTGATATGIRCWPTRSRRWRDDGVTQALAFVTCAFSSYSGCRQYREDIAARSAGGRPSGARESTSCGCSSTIPASSSR